uniref:NADH dehydrogenase subunit 2 n=1 Tax=Frankliniella panamensis TaxID=748666 RepID=UPI0026E36C6C|nr:NADH dehydrogenase subunit 2 [Frankliniella panamensis]WJO89735.1 NADH dehydrogenase subunit 2 [Frankliniella panamensis]
MKKMFFLNSMKFILLIIMSILLALSSSNLISMWMSFEINFYSFLPMLVNKKVYESEKSMVIYFWIQSIASNSFIFLVLTSKILKNNELLTYLLLMLMFLKMGMFPFQLWILSMSEKLSWFMMAFVLSIQKFLPMIMISMLLSKNKMIMLMIINSVVASLSGLKTFSMRKIMIFSSMNHLTVMLLSLLMSKKTTTIYILIYTFTNFVMSKLFYKLNYNFIYNIFIKEKMNPASSLSMMMIVFSMMGLPPFLGFVPKTMVFIFLMEKTQFVLLTIFLISNTVSSFFYLRMVFSNLIMSYNNQKAKKNIKNKTVYFILIMPFMSNFLMI